MSAKIPRGIRNHNPGNIRRDGTRWRGMSADQSADPAFVIFDHPVYGVRAMVRILRSYHRRGLDTVEEIISTWAPAVENDTGAYVTAVARALGVAPTDRLELDGPTLVALMQAIVRHENGRQPYPESLFVQAIDLAGVG